MNLTWWRTAAVTGALIMAVSSACTGTTGSKKAFCEQVAQVPSLESVLAHFSETDPDALAERISEARTAYDDLATAAPSAIESETGDVVELVNEILDAVEQNPADPAEAADQLRTAMETHQGVENSQAKVTTYALEECDIRLDATLSGG